MGSTYQSVHHPGFLPMEPKRTLVSNISCMVAHTCSAFLYLPNLLISNVYSLALGRFATGSRHRHRHRHPLRSTRSTEEHTLRPTGQWEKRTLSDQFKKTCLVFLRAASMTQSLPRDPPKFHAGSPCSANYLQRKIQWDPPIEYKDA